MTGHRTAATGVSEAAAGRWAGAPARPGSKWWALVAVCLGMFMLLLDITIVTVALLDIQHGLGSSFSGLQWIVDAYALTLAAFLLTAGSLSDMYGRRLLFLIGLIVFTGASLLWGFATSTLMLQVSRAVQGVGGAIMFATSLALLAGAFRGTDRGVAFGIWGAITGIAVAVGPLLGGVLTSGISWRWIFFVNGPVGAVAIVLSVLKVAESRQPGAARPDWPGFVLFSLALASLVYGLIESNQKSFGNSLVVGSFVAAGVLLAAFVLAELRGRHPMFDLTLFRRPAFSGGSVAAFGLSASIFAMILYLVLYLQDILGYSALGTGLRMTVMQTIAETAAGMTPDEEFWRSIYKYDDGSGGPYVTGWIAAFFAYLQTKNGPVFKGQHDIEDPFNWRRPMNGRGGGYRTSMFPSHVSTVPFVWDYFGTRYDMTFAAGVTGVDFDDDTFLAPRLGYAVVEV